MAKNAFNFYGQLLMLSGHGKKAAQLLANMLEDYTDVAVRAEEIHVVEHEADMCLHTMMNELNRSFITPIDREDLVGLTNELDDIVDSIEDVANLFDMYGIEEVRQEARTMADLILRGCEALYQAVEEFAHFKNSKKLHNYTIQVNQVEEDGDRMHRSLIKALFRTELSVIDLIKWKEIYDAMEAVLDDCEDVASQLDGVVIKNS